MKTSKIIFISLLGSIAFLILAAFIEVRITGQRNSINLSDLNVNKITIPSFKVLSINSSYVYLLQNDTSFIELTWLKDSLSPHVNYTIKEDTLMFWDINHSYQNAKFISIRIHSTDSLKSILLKNSNITIESIVLGKMSLDMDNSYAWFNQDNSSFNALDISAKNHSRVNTTAFKVDSLGIILQNSQANLGTIAKRISGVLSDSSRISARQPTEISLKKDSTCNINVNDY
jgi:hypothetical protein